MKNQEYSMRDWLLGAALIASSCGAEADTVSAILKATSGASATDYYQVSCAPSYPDSAPTHHLYFAVKDLSSDGNVVGVTGFGIGGLANAKAHTTFDTGQGDYLYGPGMTIQGGEGPYVLAVFHTGAASIQAYTVTALCYQADNQTLNSTVGLTSAVDAISNQ